MKNKFTIKDLLNNVSDIKNVYKNFANEFTKEDVMYAIDKKLDLPNLYKYLGKKFDKELKQLYQKEIKGSDERVGEKVNFQFPPRTDISHTFYNKYAGFKRRFEQGKFKKKIRRNYDIEQD